MALKAAYTVPGAAWPGLETYCNSRWAGVERSQFKINWLDSFYATF